MTVLIYLLVVFLSVVGFCEIVHSLWLRFLSPNIRGKKVLLCFLSSDTPDLELRYIIEQSEWNGYKYADEIIAFLDSDDSQLKKRCIYEAEKHNITLIC